MSALQRLTTIIEHLRRADIARHDTAKASAIAAAIRETGAYFEPETAAVIRAELSAGFVGEALEEELERILRNGDWVEIAAEAKARNRDQVDQRRLDADTSGLEWVSAANPYGWAKPDPKRRQHDHDIPGEWNPYRQAFNLAVAQRGKLGLPDHRVRGCTRWEVLGKGGKPNTAWNQADVDAAKARVSPEEITTAQSSKVYGEAP